MLRLAAASHKLQITIYYFFIDKAPDLQESFREKKNFNPFLSLNKKKNFFFTTSKKEKVLIYMLLELKGIGKQTTYTHQVSKKYEVKGDNLWISSTFVQRS